MAIMNKMILGAAVAAAMAVAAPAAQAFDTSKLTARLGAVVIVPADHSKAIPSLAVPKDAIDV